MVAVGVCIPGIDRCETEHFARLSTLWAERWIPMMRTRVKSHLFSISFHHYRRRRRCTASLLQLRRQQIVRTRQISQYRYSWATMDSLSLSRCKRICLLSEWIAEVGALSPSKHWTKAIFSHLRSLTENNQTHVSVLNGGAVEKIELISKISKKNFRNFRCSFHCHTQLHTMVHTQMRLMDLLEARDHMCNVQNWRCIVMCVSWVRLKNPKKMSDEGKKMDFQQNEKRGRMQSFK